MARPSFFLIVDDWNWQRVRAGTMAGLEGAKCKVIASIQIRTTMDESHPKWHSQKSYWHNGYFIAAVAKE
jgi:hypothetical protein